VSPGGRRPGNVDTRAQIVASARRVFAAHGYDGASLRAVARDAGVDAALVHHYFDGKADLFLAANGLPFDPRAVKHHVEGEVPGTFTGALVVEGFLTMWDQAERQGSTFASCVSAMAASLEVAEAMRQFVHDRVWSLNPRRQGEDDELWQRRTTLVSSQLMGLAFIRYLLRVPPMSTASPAEVARWVGPTLDHYVNEPLD
jgi:AcrR family transcriptional regulator